MKPFATKTSPMSHQLAAVEKVSPSRVAGLFMEMGTGKSLTAIELTRRRAAKIDKAVWFCPVSLKETVRQEIRKHTDCQNIDICVFNDKTTAKNLPSVAVRWYVVGIESMSSSNRVVAAVNSLVMEKTMVILDESSYIKGHRSMRTERLTFICGRAKYRLILTGTPISQGVVDLFSQMRFLSPKILGYSSFYSFAANHLEYSERFPDMIVRSHNVEYLAAKVQPYVYQVTKEECLDLPKKLYETRYFSMTDEQRHYYELAKDEILSDLAEDEWDSIAIFRLFSILQGIVCGFWNRRERRKKDERRKWSGNKEKEAPPVQRLEFNHARLEVLADVIRMLPENKKIIIWAKYQYDIEEIGKALEKIYGDGAVAYFYGALQPKKRTEQVEVFRGMARFFLATQSCGGHGLTLNEAHYVIFYNNAFKYSERLQAEDRCHRIGQEDRVTYIDLVCSDSIDERIQSALANKGNLVEEFKAEVNKVKDEKPKLRELIKAL